ncbi:MAG: hypothetical protein GY705_06375, partial [Bacteroidetes bacterium]|nr:hypothetical protein [Bacteroidota bacterium]
MKKSGYQFKSIRQILYNYMRFEDSVLWSDYTKDNPFVFKAWKVAKSGYANVSETSGNYGFKSGTTYSLDLKKSNKYHVKKKGALDLDLQVLFNRNESAWDLLLKVPDGGLIEIDRGTENHYMNLAPEQGYQKSLSYTGTAEDYVIEKDFFIHSRGRLYGRLVTR